MRRTIALVLPLLAVFAVAAFRSNGPRPAPLTAPAAEFSAERASRTLEWLIDQGIPHPLGTRANALVRSGLVSQFRSLGYETQVQRRLACNAGGECGFVENVIAEAPGERRGDAIAMIAHYDSVGAGPGASDDTMGVAALLEIARAVKDQKFRNRVLFLATDGEEAGLLGAEAFVADAELSKGVAVVVNVENRGTFGASNLFETSRGNRWLIRRIASALPHPQASSFYPAVYELLPNDTDVTVFRRAGKAAVNFAAIRGVHWYHTPLDDVDHASPRTLQHHGENALGTLRALADADLAARSPSDAVFFDVLGLTLLWWPAGWTVWIAVISLAVLVFVVRREVPRELTFGVLATFTAVLLSLLTGSALAWLAAIRDPGTNWVAYPGTLIASMWLSGIASAFAAAAIFRSRAGTGALLYGTGIVWHVIAIVLSVTMPGASYLFLVPALAITAAALARLGETATAALASTAAAVVFFPIAVVLYDTLGGRLAVAGALVIGIVATLFAPLVGRWPTAIPAALVATGCAIAAAMMPPFSVEKPQRISITYVDDSAAKTAQWVVPAVTPPLARVARFEKTEGAIPPWPRAAWTAAVPRAELQRVQLVGRREGNRVFVRVRSARRANRVSLLVRGGVSDIIIGGAKLPPPSERFHSSLPAGWTSLSATAGDGMAIEMTAPGKIELIASDLTYGLPRAGAALVRARNESPAVPVQDGDVTITRARISL